MHSEESDLIDFAFPVLVLNSAPSQHQFQLQSSTETDSGNVTGLQKVAVWYKNKYPGEWPHRVTHFTPGTPVFRRSVSEWRNVQWHCTELLRGQWFRQRYPTTKAQIIIICAQHVWNRDNIKLVVVVGWLSSSLSQSKRPSFAPIYNNQQDSSSSSSSPPPPPPSSSIDATTLGRSWSVQQFYSTLLYPLPSPSNQ